MAFLTSPDFWVALMQIILINIVLSGDNAVVIALACRSLPPKQQKNAIIFGSIGAIVLRVILTFFAVFLLSQPYLKLVGAALLLWIGIGLLKGDDGEEDIESNAGLMAAIKTIIIADLVMSLDNVIGVAAAAKGNVPLLIIGLVISIPLIIFGSTIILKLMNRFPIIITIGAALLGWVAGEMAVSDPAIKAYVDANMHYLHTVAPAVGAVIVVALGKYLASRAESAQEEAAADQPAA
ncbi:TerC family protein [Ramlibacter sp. AN1133]|uniref:TerC family protein n=1 Tax=Ramlibacter sp. AN1133 TaxID=3133429 RepID=UPI0030C026DD